MLIETTNLQLIPYAPEHLLALIDSEESFYAAFGILAAEGLRGFLFDAEVSPTWLAQLRAAAPGTNPWQWGFAIVHQTSGSVIGMIGFKGPPDDQGMVEIAYGIVPTFQGQGYATEANLAVIDFACKDPSVQLIWAHTAPTANTSTRVLEKCGFEFMGEVTDPEDGLVWRWQLKKANRL